MLKKKLKASFIHFLISFIVIITAFLLIIYFWYPDSTFKISTFKEIATLVIAIDMVLGPLLTFIIFKPHKKSLKFDLTTIALLQIGALIFGIYNLYLAHPVYIVFNIDRFTLVSAVDARPADVKLSSLETSKLYSPKYVVTKLPEDIVERNKLILDTLEKGRSDFVLKSQYYLPYAEYKSIVPEKSLDPKIVFETDGAKKELDKFLNKYGKSVTDYIYLPVQGALKDAVWALDAKTIEPVDILPILPWSLDISEESKK